MIRTVVILCTLSVAVGAQTPAGFEVASVKRTQGAPGVLPFVYIQSGRLRAPFSTVRELIQAAYGVEPTRVLGGPDWIDAEHFEIIATVPDRTTADRAQAMLRELLAERFGLVTRSEKRDLPVYVLTRAGRMGPDLAPAGPDCKPPKAPAGLPAPPPPPPPPFGAAPITVLNQVPRSNCFNAMFRGYLSLRAAPMSTFVTHLSNQLGRPIVDRTGLTGIYDIDLLFLPDTGPMMMNGTALNADAPALATAIREQLGLRLDSDRAPIDVIVIDRVNAPTEN
jgi:uncharacterized protein (TIGR03435 family)